MAFHLKIKILTAKSAAEDARARKSVWNAATSIRYASKAANKPYALHFELGGL